MIPSLAAGAVILPFVVAIGASLAGAPLQGAWLGLGAAALTFALTLAAPLAPGDGLLHADALGLGFGMLTGFIAFVTAVQNLAFVTAEATTMSVRRWRAYHALGLVVLGAVLLGLYADNIGLLWVAMETATIAGTLAVSLARTDSALEAGWKYFILGGVGIALALFGTMLVYLSAQPAIGPGLAAMSFAALDQHAAALDGPVLTLAFVFLLFGYGTKAAIVPLHGWLPDAYAEGPAPLTAVLSGLTLNVALLAILRFRHLAAQNASAMPPGPFLLTLGLASLALPAFSLAQRRDARRFLGFSSIEHAGLAVFAFGLGGAAAIFGALLQMALHSLIKAAVLQSLIRAALRRGDAGPGAYGFARLRGMAATSPALGWLLGAAMFGLAGLPPSGLFASEFIIISQTILRDPWLSAPLGLCLVLCAIAILRTIGPLVFAPPPKASRPAKAGWDMGLTALQLAAAVLLAFAMPPALVALLSRIAAGLA
jgi:hydrogenase-4 component F